MSGYMPCKVLDNNFIVNGTIAAELVDCRNMPSTNYLQCDCPADQRGAGEPRLTSTIPMHNPYCSCKVSHGLQLQSPWIIPNAAAR